MIRRIQRTNDLKDIIRSCPSGVIEDIHEVRYYIYGNEGKYISASLSLEGDVLVAVLPSQELQRLSNGILYRKAFYSVADESYPDGHLDLEFVDNMNLWLGDINQETPSGEYLTADDLKTINGQSIVGIGDIHIEGGDVDLSDYFTKEETETKIAQHILANNGRIADEYYNREAVDAKMADKADRSEIPGPFKTINGQSILGEGDITIQGGEGGGLTPEQEAAINHIPEIDQQIVELYGLIPGMDQQIGELSGRVDFAEGELAEKADRSEIPSLEGYATETWVNSQGFAKKTAENDYSGVNKFEGDATYFGNYYNLGGRTYIQQNGDIYDKGKKLENKYALKSDIPTFKTINGESIVGEGNITIQGGGADLPEYIKDDYIEFGNPEEGENLTQYTPNQIYMHQNGYDTSYSELGFNIWNTDRELGVNASDEGLSSASSAYGSTWMGAIYMPGDEEPDHYGLQVLDVDGTHISELNNNGITFWDYDQTTEEGEVDWENPTITDITKEELIEVKNISNKVDRSEIWTGTQAEWDALTDTQKASYIIALVR